VRLPLCLFVLATAPAAWPQAAGEDDRFAADIIAECSESASEDAVGLTQLEQECPGLTAVLEESGYLPLLSSGQRERFDVYDLGDLQRMRARYEQPPDRLSVDVDGLRPILDSLREQHAQRPLTWFERFKKWLRQLLERPQDDSESWLSRWLEDVEISDAVSRAILFGLSVLVIALALGVVINELRVSGVLRRRSRGNADPISRPFGSRAAGPDAELDALTAERRVPVVLQMLVATLVRSGRLRTERSLTHRELCRQAKFDDPQQRQSFRRVAELAERVVYADGDVPPEEIEPVVAAARVLNAQLSGATA
jgi:hypothetical protein